MNKKDLKKLVSVGLLIISGISISEYMKLKRKSNFNKKLAYRKIALSKLIDIDTLKYTVVINFGEIDSLYINFINTIKSYPDIYILERTNRFMKLDLSKSKLRDFTIDEVKIFIMDLLDFSYIKSIE